MTGSQQVCAETQVAVDKRAHGVALEPEQRRLVDEHLPTCTTCRAFATTLEQTEKLMHAHTAVLRRQVDLTALGESARAAITKQKRGMVRGLIALGALVGLCATLYVSTGDADILWPGLGLLAVGAYAIVGDLARLRLTRRWAEQPPRLDAGDARRERKLAVFKLAAFAVLGLAPVPLPGIAGALIQSAIGLCGLVGVFHYVFVVRALSREIRALRA